jgi:hypothetical protein
MVQLDAVQSGLQLPIVGGFAIPNKKLYAIIASRTEISVDL